MTTMIWNEEMTVGVEELDRDHKKLIALLNEVEDAISAGRSSDSMNEILQRVMESVKSHFAREEKFLFDSGYPDAAARRSEHDLILKTGLELQARFRNSSSSMNSHELRSSLQNWLDNHIQGADMKFGPHLNAHGIH